MENRKNIFSFIRDCVDIVTVISEYVSLRQYGNYWKGLSPFKPEKTPSFTVTPDKKIYYCFSTGTGGDVINFISRIEGCTQYESVMILTKKYNIKIPKDIFNENIETSTKEIHIKCCELFMTWCQNQLVKNNEAVDYLKNREITEESINRFHIGYCPSSIFYLNDFLKIAQKNNILISDLIDAGILNDKKDKKYYFPYEERIIFPIMNNFGLCTGFSGRIFKKNDLRSKYLNSFSNKEFSKKEILYGLYLAKKRIQKEKKVYLVEGYFDVIGFFQSGYENVVATMGTACNEEHIITLEKIISELIVVYDGDTAGQKAVLKLTNFCWKNSLSLKIVVLPEGEDPDSLSKKNLLNSYLEGAVDSIDFYVSLKTRNFLNLDFKEKMIVISELIDCLIFIKDEIKRAIIVSDISKKIGISQNLIEKEISKRINLKEDVKVEKKEIREIKNENHLSNKKLDLIWLCFSISCILNFEKNNKEIKVYSEIFNEKDTPLLYKELWHKFLSFVEKEKTYDHLLFFDTIDIGLRDKLLWGISLYQFNLNHVGVFYRELKKIKLKYILNNFGNEDDSFFLNNDLKNYFNDISFFYKKNERTE